MWGSWDLRQLFCDCSWLCHSFWGPTPHLYTLCPEQLLCRVATFTSPLFYFPSGSKVLCVCLHLCVYLGKRAICKESTEVSYCDHISKNEEERDKGAVYLQILFIPFSAL